jgi:hypothetical protein
VPAAPHQLFAWLLEGRHAILAGAAYHKKKYVSGGSAMNLPRMAAIYNAGALAYAAQGEYRQLHAGPQNNPWRLDFNDLRYPIDSARYYNAIQDLFHGGGNGRARLWKIRI